MGKKHLTITDYESILLLKDMRHEQYPKDIWCVKMQQTEDTSHKLFYMLRKIGLFVADDVKINNGRVIPLYRISMKTYRTILTQCPLVWGGFLFIAEEEIARNAFAHFTEPDDLQFKTLRERLATLQRRRRAKK